MAGLLRRRRGHMHRHRHRGERRQRQCHRIGGDLRARRDHHLAPPGEAHGGAARQDARAVAARRARDLDSIDPERPGPENVGEPNAQPRPAQGHPHQLAQGDVGQLLRPQRIAGLGDLLRSRPAADPMLRGPGRRCRAAVRPRRRRAVLPRCISPDRWERYHGRASRFFQALPLAVALRRHRPRRASSDASAGLPMPARC